MRGKLMLYIDQYGRHYMARTVKELASHIGRKHVGRMYRDKPLGRTVHVGYVIGQQWLTAYVPFEAKL